MRHLTRLPLLVLSALACLQGCGDPDCPDDTVYDGLRCAVIRDGGPADGAAGTDAGATADAGPVTDAGASTDAGVVDCATLDCDDGNPCTADACTAEAGCSHTLIDGDGDGFAAGTCPAGTPGGDCDDGDSTVYPGAPELCDEIDNDCDGAVDEEVTIVTCMRDRDGDGFGDPADTVDACACPAGFIPPRSDGRVDCYDGSAQVHPDQTSYFEIPICGGLRPCHPAIPPPVSYWDYDCDDTATWRYTDAITDTLDAVCHTFIGCGGSTGWSWGTPVPDCGVEGTWSSCGRACTTCSCERVAEPRRQACR